MKFICFFLALTAAAPAYAGDSKKIKNRVPNQLNQSARADFTFTADNSYKNENGECHPSLFHAAVIWNKLYIYSVLTGVGELTTLTQAQMKSFQKLANRDLGEPGEVKVRVGNENLLFKGETCGKMLCNSLSIANEKTGKTMVLEEPIHAFEKIGCN